MAMPVGQDFAKAPGLNMRKLERFLDDIRTQPEWRAEADRACAYYDGKQLTPEQLEELRRRGQPALIHNLIGPAIDGVLGLEARTRADFLVRADDDDSMEVAEALNERHNEAARLARVDRACADAFGGQAKCGLDWVEVSRNSDPFGSAYRCQRVHRNEIWWDFRSVNPDLSDARWMLRRRWVDEDEAIIAFPQHAELLKYASNGWDVFNTEQHLMARPDLLAAYEDFSSTDMFLDDWNDSERDQLLIYEVYYRHFVRRPVMFLHDGRVLEVDPKNRMHQAAIATGKVRVQTMAFPKMRMAYFCGPHRLVDVDSPHPHNHFPYVPFFGFREDSTNIPYGLCRRMMPAQDEVNHRRSKLTHQLNSKLLVMDSDALDGMSYEDAMDEIYSADGVITLDPARQNRDHNAFRIETESGIAQQQFQVMQEAQRIIQETAGIYSAFLGQESSAKSGVAIDSLVEQGSTTLAELTDNYRFARQQVGELLLAHIVSDLSDIPDVEQKTNIGTPDKSKVIFLNATNGSDRPATNVVARAKVRVVLGDITSTPSYRAQISQRMMELASSLPPEMQMVMLDLIIESTDLPNRDKIVERIRETTGRGMDPEDMSPEQQQAMKEEQQLQQFMKQLGMEEAKQKVNKLAGEARRLHAQATTEEGKANMNPAELRKLDAETEYVIAQMKEVVTDIATKRRDLLNREQHGDNYLQQ